MIPEVHSLIAPQSVVRIPPELDVPLSPRVRRLLDSTPMRRLSRISQLGLVGLVYPGATHSRLEHSLGVYRCALLVLQRLSSDGRFRELVSEVEAEAFVIAALLHDCGHWPFCHPIEDMRLPGMITHESRVRTMLAETEVADLVEKEWSCRLDSVWRILNKQADTDGERLLISMLSGPIDIDKMDYLMRDSLHAGVPYGRNFDVGRLITSLQVHPQLPQIAISEKGKTAAEMMVFARYVMFSEVYWHHAVRSATAMLQRVIYLLLPKFDLAATLDLDEAAWIARLKEAARGSIVEGAVLDLFGSQRRLYKRIAQFNVLDQPDLHRALAHRPYKDLVAASDILVTSLSHLAGTSFNIADILIDAPPQKLEVDINIDVVMAHGNVRSLAEVSPVVEALARRQFDSHVKQVRVFAHSRIPHYLPDGQLPVGEIGCVLHELNKRSNVGSAE